MIKVNRSKYSHRPCVFGSCHFLGLGSAGVEALSLTNLLPPSPTHYIRWWYIPGTSWLRMCENCSSLHSIVVCLAQDEWWSSRVCPSRENHTNNTCTCIFFYATSYNPAVGAHCYNWPYSPHSTSVSLMGRSRVVLILPSFNTVVHSTT